ALECDDLTAPPETFALGGWPEITIGRGPARSLEGDRLRFAARRLSEVHARLVRARDRWRVVGGGGRARARVNGGARPAGAAGAGATSTAARGPQGPRRRRRRAVRRRVPRRAPGPVAARALHGRRRAAGAPHSVARARDRPRGPAQGGALERAGPHLVRPR